MGSMICQAFKHSIRCDSEALSGCDSGGFTQVELPTRTDVHAEYKYKHSSVCLPQHPRGASALHGLWPSGSRPPVWPSCLSVDVLRLSCPVRLRSGGKTGSMERPRLRTGFRPRAANWPKATSSKKLLATNRYK